MKRLFLMMLIVIVGLTSCNDNDIFQKEMYKNIVALITNDTYNRFKEVVPLSASEEAIIGYIASCTGGTLAPKRHWIVELKEDSLLMDIYNNALYDLDETRYPNFLASDKN